MKRQNVKCLHNSYFNTSCPLVAPLHAASRHADRHYGQFRNIKYSTFYDPAWWSEGHYHYFTKVIGSFIGQHHPYFRGETMHVR